VTRPRENLDAGASAHLRVDPDEAEALRLTFEKDGLLVEYQTKAPRWQALHGAGLALLGVAGFAFLTGSLRGDQFLAALLTVGLMVGVGTGMMKRYDQTFRRRMEALLRKIESLKRNRGP
jgi:hypothetical protein